MNNTIQDQGQNQS